MVRILLIGFSYILPIGLGYWFGFLNGVKICDDTKFEKRWEDCE